MTLSRLERPKSSGPQAKATSTGADGQAIAVLKAEVVQVGLVDLPNHGIALVAQGQSINGFRLECAGHAVQLSREADGSLIDAQSRTIWDPRGKYVRGPIAMDLEPVRVSDEYWFSWRFFHADGQVVSTLQTALAAANMPV